MTSSNVFSSRLLFACRLRPGDGRRQNLDRFLDRFDGAFRRARAVRDQIVGAMEIEPADLADAGRDQQIRRIAGEPRPGDAVLHDVESIDHHRGYARPCSGAEKLALDGALGRKEICRIRAWTVRARSPAPAPRSSPRRGRKSSSSA